MRIGLISLILAVAAGGAGPFLWPFFRRTMSKPLPKGQCTWYVWERAGQAGWVIRFDQPYGRHAKEWPKRVTNGRLFARPIEGDLMILGAWKGNPYGHVAYVESVPSKGRAIVTHANMRAGSEVSPWQGVTVRRAEVDLLPKAVRFESSKTTLPLIGFLRRLE
jgi:surface antigen